MYVPEQYYGLTPSEWPDHLWETEYKGATIQGKLTSLNHSPSGHLVFSVGEVNEEEGIAIVIVASYQKFRPILPDKPKDWDEEDEEVWKRRMIKHDMMATSLRHLEEDPGGAILLG